MWFVLFKIFRFGYSETKKYKAKKAQQQQPGTQQFQQPPYPNPYFQNPPPNDPSRGPVPGGQDSYSMEPLPMQTPPATLSKRGKAKDLLALVLAIAQFAFGLAVIGLYSQDITAAHNKHKSAPSRWVYAVVTAFLSTSSALVYLVLGWWWQKRSKPVLAQRERLFLPLFVWESILVILWLVVFGIFGEMYIGVYHVGGNDGGDDKVTRMRRAVWVDLVCLLMWAGSAGWRGLRWWKAKGRKDAGEGDGMSSEKEMV
ncbi:hypothetical protein BJY01DRAFT_210867 [Aspergillus pseudoustus]|uniref:MARVEL domain-containing protein n=1 Tax=Aspergillus pseudoustus TaxID=1810923 RepID=A0ABR4KA95_9EURO